MLNYILASTYTVFLLLGLALAVLAAVSKATDETSLRGKMVLYAGAGFVIYVFAASVFGTAALFVVVLMRGM